MSVAARMAIDPDSFRTALSHFSTGVTVVSTTFEDGMRAMTATAFSSVSLSPPIVLVCIRAQARIDEAIRRSGRFAISILSDQQEEISRQFGRTSADTLHPAFEPWDDLPVVAGALTHIAADVDEIIAGGDHNIFLGKVTATRVSSGEPLVHFRGGYRRQTS